MLCRVAFVFYLLNGLLDAVSDSIRAVAMPKGIFHDRKAKPLVPSQCFVSATPRHAADEGTFQTSLLFSASRETGPLRTVSTLEVIRCPIQGIDSSITSVFEQ